MWISFLLFLLSCFYNINIIEGESGNLIREAIPEYRGYENIGTGPAKKNYKVGTDADKADSSFLLLLVE